MALRIIYKGDQNIIPQFRLHKLGPFELYIRNAADFKTVMDDVVAVHFHYKLEDGRKINLADTGELGTRSQEMLKQAIWCAKRNNARKLVIHPPTINRFTQDKKEAIKIFVRRLEKASDPDVQICLENVCLWINQIYTNEPLFTAPQDFLDIVSECNVPLASTIDIEHYSVTSVMKLFYEKMEQPFKDLQQGTRDYDGIRQEFEQMLRGMVEKISPPTPEKESELHEHCHRFILQAMQMLKKNIAHVHSCGSDFHHYLYNRKTGFPVLGEHLPLGFSGDIEGVKIKDRLNHASWIKPLQEISQEFQKDIDIVMEISPREEYDFFPWIIKSRNLLQQQLTH